MQEKYWAHYRGEDQAVQPLKDHLVNVGELCGKFASKFGFEDVGRVLGLLHDMGKYSDDFQNRIQHSGPIVDHSTAGAKIAWECFGDRWERFSDILFGYAIAGHHTGLCDAGSAIDAAGDATYQGRMKKDIPEYSAWRQEIQIPEVDFPRFPEGSVEPSHYKKNALYFSFLTRMLYSCLVDADFLDTENFMRNGKQERGSRESLSVILKKATEHIAKKGWLEPASKDNLNGRRREILQACITNGRNQKRGFYRLTVPTGGGKTVSSFMFALEQAVKNKMDRIIYVAPFTTIIEQNASVLKKLAGEYNVLEHYSSFDFEGSKELRKLELATENWDVPIVVTTNVQFFESFYGNKSSQCRKLHNVANSVIIFDEVQSLPDEYLLPCLETIKQLTQYYGCSSVFCTATQPSLDQMLGDIIPFELCPNVEEQFAAFKRHRFENKGVITEDDLVDQLSREKQALCVVNTRAIAQSLYRKLGPNSGIYCLSTLMTPRDRKVAIEEIKEGLDRKDRCVVISTSLIEAGVDLDFKNVYRQLAGIDSILQAAGRCNRGGNEDSEDCKVYVFQFEEPCTRGEQSRKASVAQVLLEKGRSLEDLQIIDDYFSELYALDADGHDQKGILNLFSCPGTEQFREAAQKMTMIEKRGVDLIVPNPEIEDLIAQLWYGGGLSKEDFRRLQKFIIQIPSWKIDALLSQGQITRFKNMIDLYQLEDSTRYTSKMGLDLDHEIGEVLFF
ncbi:CRISPR-associated helicase Cas3' [Allobaculum stercoricanis]|uniref:CRISPR-associated helicase Cas3' n=1 Tax=Allobaculum stercoricanis TaxID=174709 RepID=UPI00248EC607|nr:CRISPR-associated helicase Cas3' [Allobaculum stercoricanis]